MPQITDEEIRQIREHIDALVTSPRVKSAIEKIVSFTVRAEHAASRFGVPEMDAAISKKDFARIRAIHEGLLGALEPRNEVLGSAVRLVYESSKHRSAQVARAGAVKRQENDPRSEAMSSVRAEFYRWQSGEARYDNDANFATKMRLKYPALTNEGSIKNACNRWRKATKSSS
jgi:hypothetical protein